MRIGKIRCVFSTAAQVDSVKQARSPKLKWNRRIRAAGLVLALLTLGAFSALAQVPQDMTFSGRLVDGSGTPLVGPVEIIPSLYDTPTGGTPLYTDDFFAVPLDAQGNFTVLLGTGSYPGGGTFDADLFTTGDLYVGVVLGPPHNETLTPRVPLSSVPYALVAQQANEIVPDSSAPRFEGCGDGTVADHQTGLQWEKKTGTLGAGVACRLAGCTDPHVVNNTYPWTSTGTVPDGGVFTDFLPRLNGEFDPHAATGCFADHCDWELPTISELQTILIGPEAAPGQSTTCSVAPCIAPDFAAIGGPTQAWFYWSQDAPPGAAFAYGAIFIEGTVSLSGATNDLYVRAVRAGSCN